MKEGAVIQGALNFAIGVERLLKGILFDINPIYILTIPEFQNSLKIFYKNKIVVEEKNSEDIKKSPKSEVITFRNSLLRAAKVSPATQKNKNKLFELSHTRDILVHQELSILDLDKTRLLLQRDFYFICLDFIDELSLSKKAFFGKNEELLIDVSWSLQEDIKNIIRIKLEDHRKNWSKVRGDAELIVSKNAITDELLQNRYRHEIPCPACNQRAILFVEPDYLFDAQTGEMKDSGEFIRSISCEFCSLQIADAAELDEIGYGKFIGFESLDDDIPF